MVTVLALALATNAGCGTSQLEPCQTSGAAIIELKVEQGGLVVQQTLHLTGQSSGVKPSHDLRQHGLLAEQLISAELLLYDHATSADELYNNQVAPARRINLNDVTAYNPTTQVLRVVNGGRKDDPVVELLGGEAPSRALKLTYIARASRLSDDTARFRISLGLPVTLSQEAAAGRRFAPLLCGPDKLRVLLRMNLPGGVKPAEVSAFSNYETRSEPITTDGIWGLDETITLAAHPPLAVWIDLPRRAVPKAQEDPFGAVGLRFLYGDRSYAGVAPRLVISVLILLGLFWSRARGGGSYVSSYLVLRVLAGNLALLAPLWLQATGLIHLERFGVLEGAIVYGTWALDGLYLLPLFITLLRSGDPDRGLLVVQPAGAPDLVGGPSPQAEPVAVARPVQAPPAASSNKRGSSSASSKWTLSSAQDAAVSTGSAAPADSEDGAAPADSEDGVDGVNSATTDDALDHLWDDSPGFDSGDKGR